MEHTKKQMAERRKAMTPAALNVAEQGRGYRGDFLRTKGSQRPLFDFIRMGKLHQKTFVTGDGSVFLVFIPERFLADSEKFGFYRKNFLTKYFMCEFYLRDDGWRMMNLCLGETDNVVFPESIPN